jgi:peroxiredoxin
MQATVIEGSHPLPAGSVMPDLTLPGDLSPEHLHYLGLNGPGPHRLSDIKAGTVILLAFSMYCPHCQREAPVLNELAALIESRGLAGDVKLIGVGIGNSDFEVDVFRKKYAVTFPLFSDPDFQTNKAIGEVGTPFFYILDGKAGNGEFRVVDTMLGRMESAPSFLERTLKAAGR